MALDELRKKALEKIENNNPGCTDFKVHRTLEHILDGTLISIAFLNTAGKDDTNHVHFGQDEVRTYRWNGDVLSAIAGKKERLWFFRFIELSGIGGVIAFLLIIIFATFLCALAFYQPDLRKDVLDVVKLSFTTILGYFFGSQVAAKR